MYTITFYSFKGGVGRTMALVNVAAHLAKMGRKVLIVDFDLEAPGLETFQRLRPQQAHPGVVEYVTEYVRTKCSPDVREYIYSAGRIGNRDGQLWVMPAGRRDTDYQRKLNRLDWKKLYDDCKGFLFFEDLKGQWELLAFKPDYVLIDSRTGHTDVKGICTRQLPDAVVLLFIPNEQNFTGLLPVCREILHEREHGLKKDIQLHFVASNVPALDDEDRRLRRRLSEFRKALGAPDAPIPIIHRYETLQMLDQPIFVWQRPRTRLAAEYRFLVRALQIENPADRDGALLFLNEVQKERSRLIDEMSKFNKEWRFNRDRERFLERMRPLFEKFYPGQQTQEEDSSPQQQSSDPVKDHENQNMQEEDSSPQQQRSDPIKKHVNQITDQFWEDADILFRVGKYLLGRNEPEMALKRFNRTLVLQPDLADALFERAFCRRQLRQDELAAEDLLRYLRDYGSKGNSSTDLPESSEKDLIQKKRLEKKNEKALLELLSISLDEFLKTLELPLIATPHGGSLYIGWLLHRIPVHLIRQRRWEDAIRLLDHPKVKEAQRRGKWELERAKNFHAFHWAIAHWGKAGEPCRELCLQALHAFLQDFDLPDDALDLDNDPLDLDPALYQWCALLYWGAGDTESAARLLDYAIASLDESNEIMDGISYWTFQETIPREFRLDCEEMRRMIQGEPIRPAFLG